MLQIYGIWLLTFDLLHSILENMAYTWNIYIYILPFIFRVPGSALIGFPKITYHILCKLKISVPFLRGVYYHNLDSHPSYRMSSQFEGKQILYCSMFRGIGTTGNTPGQPPGQYSPPAGFRVARVWCEKTGGNGRTWTRGLKCYLLTLFYQQ